VGLKKNKKVFFVIVMGAYLYSSKELHMNTYIKCFFCNASIKKCKYIFLGFINKKKKKRSGKRERERERGKKILFILI